MHPAAAPKIKERKSSPPPTSLSLSPVIFSKNQLPPATPKVMWLADTSWWCEQPPLGQYVPTTRASYILPKKCTTSTTIPTTQRQVVDEGKNGIFVPLTLAFPFMPVSHYRGSPQDPPSLCSNSRGILRGSSGDPL